jgi:hypothetical protein
MAPTYGNGKICYVEIPAVEIQRSAISTRRCSPGRRASVATARSRSTTASAR